MPLWAFCFVCESSGVGIDIRGTSLTHWASLSGHLRYWASFPELSRKWWWGPGPRSFLSLANAAVSVFSWVWPAVAFCPDACWLHRARVTSFILGGAGEGGWGLHVVKVPVPMCFCCIANTYSWILCFFTQKQIGLARHKWSFRSSNCVCVWFFFKILAKRFVGS